MRQSKRQKDLVCNVFLSVVMRTVLLICLLIVNVLGYQFLETDDIKRDYVVDNYASLDYQTLLTEDEYIVNIIDDSINYDTDDTTDVKIDSTEFVEDVKPVKTTYLLNETLDISNLQITLVMSNGAIASVPIEELMVITGDTDKVGTNVVTIAYEGLIDTYDIYVRYDVMDVEHVTKYASDVLELYSGPGTTYGVANKVPFNTAVVVTGVIEDWSRVVYNNQEYYCVSSCLMDNKYVKTDPVYDGPYDNIIVGEKGTDTSVINTANIYWNKYVPMSVKKYFVESGWHLVVSATSLQTRFNYDSSIAGLTVEADRTVYLDNRKTAVVTALLHEVGHAIDLSKGGLYGAGSYSQEFEKLWKLESANFVDCTGGVEYARSTPQEYFASVFANIILSPNTCKKQCPKTYTYVKSYIP